MNTLNTMNRRTVIPNTSFFALVEEAIAGGRTVEIAVRGTSMRPTLVDGRHRVVLAPCGDRRPPIGTIALVRYNGRHILHRLVAREADGTLVFRGDNLPHTVERVTAGDIVGVVRSIVGPGGRVRRSKGLGWALRSRLSAAFSPWRVLFTGRLRRLFSGLRRREGKRTEVLFFIESLAGGGAEKILSVIARHLDPDRFRVSVRTVTAGGAHFADVARAVDCRPMIRTRRRLPYTLLYHLIYYVLPARLVRALFLPRGSDVEVAFCEGFATRVIASGRSRRRVAWVHTDLESNPWTQQLVYRSLDQERRAYSRFDEVVCVSDSVREAFERRFDLSARTLYNPVDSDAIARLAGEPTPLPPKTLPRLVSTGRLIDLKGYDRLLSVAAQLGDEGHPFELWILGEGPRREALEDFIAAHNLGDRVRLWGFVANPYPLVASADLFVCSSRSEGYSTAATEAIVLGVPVVTTLVAGMGELLGDGLSDWIVPNDDSALLAPLRRLLSEPALLADLRRKATLRGGHFTLPATMLPIEQLLR